MSALENGYRYFDCAFIYRNEKEIGEAFAKAFASGIVRREDVWITSKLWNNRHQPDEVIPALRSTLADLQLEYLDLYLTHWPVAYSSDVIFPEKPEHFHSPKDLPLSETWKGMEAALEAGLCRHIGVSNVNPVLLEKLVKTAKHPPEFDQVECHPFLAQHELLEVCKKHGIILTAYSPLGTGKEKSPDTPDVHTNPALKSIAMMHDATPAQIAIAWAIQRGTNVIPKSNNPARQLQNLEATHINLTADEMSRIDSLDRNYRFIDGTQWTAMEGSPYTLEWLWKSKG
eukprot:g3721.t1